MRSSDVSIKKGMSITTQRSKRLSIERLGFIVRVLLGICFISPLIIGLIFSFLPNNVLDKLPTFKDIADNLTLENYAWIFKNIPIIRFITNSLVMCAIIITAQIIFASFAAYALAFFNFKGKKLLFNLVLVGMMIPGQVTVIANFLNIQKFGLVNTYPGLCLPYLIGGTAIFMMRQYYLTIPKELKDASVIDGCSDLRFLFSIAAPLSVPSIAALGIYLFIDVFNMYLWPMLVAQKQVMQTIQIGMSMLVDADAQQYGRILAGAVICISIPLCTFLFGQDYLVKGMTAGAVKG